jgi:hypothetical protein
VEDPQVRARLLGMAREGTLSSAVYVMLFHYAYGKPREEWDIHVQQTIFQVELD